MPDFNQNLVPLMEPHPQGDAECAADVLVVDESIGERDPAAEKGGQSALFRSLGDPTRLAIV